MGKSSRFSAVKLAQGLFLFGLAVFVSSCGGEKIEVYRVPKEKVPALPPALSQPSSEKLIWQKPSGWKEKPLSTMRKGSFEAQGSNGKKVDISVVALRGQSGGIAANVNRWRQQVGLELVSEKEIRSNLERVTIGSKKSGQKGVLVDLIGKKDRIVAAIHPNSQQTWFYKMTGDVKSVGEQKTAFVQFLSSVQLEEPSSAKKLSAVRSKQQVSWKVPKEWEKRPLGKMRRGSYQVAQNNQKVDISVTAFPGQAGGVLPNVNRWRKQLSLSEWTKDQLQKNAKTIPVGGHEIIWVMFEEKKGGEKKKGMMAAILGVSGETWFFKMTGDLSLVRAQEQNFEKVLKSVVVTKGKR